MFTYFWYVSFYAALDSLDLPSVSQFKTDAEAVLNPILAQFLPVAFASFGAFFLLRSLTR